MKTVMEKASRGDISIHLQVEHARFLQLTVGSGWNSKLEMGVDSKEGLIAKQNSAVSQNLHGKTYQFICMIHNAYTHALKDST